MKILLSDILYRKNISYRQASILTGISKTKLHNIAVGKNSMDLDTAEAIAKGLDVRITDLFESDFK